jgi:hypothetical protein
VKVAIITSVSGKSSKALAEHLRFNNVQADVFRPFKDGRQDFTDYDFVFSYGCSIGTAHKKRINQRVPVLTCINKHETFKVFEAAGVPTVNHWTDINAIRRLLAKGECPTLVVRSDVGGRKAEGYDIFDPDSGAPLPVGALYSEYFWHERELRVTVFMDEVFVYRKDLDADEMHNFIFTNAPVHDTNIKKDELKARKALGIDFVSFDVLFNRKNDYRFLEANSGTLLTDEVSDSIVEYFINL